MWPMICLHVSIWCNLSASLYLHRKVNPHCKTTINQKNKPKHPTGPPLCSGHAGGPLGNVLLHLMDAFDGVYLWQQSTCTWNRKWVMENKADVGAVQLYDSTHRSRQGVTYSAVHWRHSSALTAVIGNGVVACGAQRVCMCDGVCVRVCECAVSTVVETVSQRSRQKTRERPLVVPPPPLPRYAASKSFQLCLLYASVCASESLSAQEQNMSCMIVQVYEITTLVAGPYFKSCDSWSAPAYADLLG